MIADAEQKGVITPGKVSGGLFFALCLLIGFFFHLELILIMGVK